ncbi:MAG: hypothetical protein HQL20_06780 [Candidatus Omnitrophica bacterium]|nr:hypothetical protein [Candidatus Omnitrophota bacterium]
MNKDDVIANMCRLAVNWKTVGDMSINDWVRASGWLLHRESISLDDIKGFLKVAPELVDGWLLYSEDKRCDSGWYFTNDEMLGYFVVGHYGSNTGYTKVEKYRDSIEACAVFIMNEFNGFKLMSRSG